MSLEERTNTRVCIELNNNNQHGENVFMPGETITGRVIVFCPSPITIRGILVRISGQVKCQFVEVSGERNITHIGEETFIADDFYLLGSDMGSLRLETGSSFYSFQHQLPDSLPMSLPSKFGNIRYWISVILNRPMRFDTRVDLNFTIKTDLNLNDFPELKAPLEAEWAKHYFVLGCCICIKTGILYMSAKIAVCGYVAGNTIVVKLRIENKSDHPIQSFSIKLVELVTCHPYPITANVYESSENALTEQIIEGCPGISTDERRISIKVPAGSDYRPSNDQSNVLKLKHGVKITGKAGRCHIDPVLFIPIKLGTINWERRPSIAPSEVGPDFSESSPANVGDNIYQAEYLNWNSS